MKYTSEKPTQSGWYWFRYWSWNSDEPIEYMIHVYEEEGKMWVRTGREEEELSEFGEPHPVSPVRCEYAGPIEKPE